MEWVPKPEKFTYLSGSTTAAEAKITVFLTTYRGISGAFKLTLKFLNDKFMRVKILPSQKAQTGD